MKDALSYIASWLAIALYVPTLILIWTDKLKQSFATWLLWVILDGIALGTIIAKNGENTRVLICYVIGGSAVAVSLFCKDQFKWGTKETVTSLLVLVCLGIWKLAGPTVATVATTIAVCISSIPQFLESRSAKFDRDTGLIYIGYAVANTLYFFAGKEWAIKDRFYPFMMIPTCLALVWAALYKKSPKNLFYKGVPVATLK